MKGFYKGIFMFMTGAKEEYVRAYSLEQAKTMLAFRISSEQGVSYEAVIKWMEDNPNSYKIELIEHNDNLDDYKIQITSWLLDFDELQCMQEKWKSHSEVVIKERQNKHTLYYALFRKLNPDEEEGIKKGIYEVKGGCLRFNPKQMTLSFKREMTTVVCMRCGNTFKTFNSTKKRVCSQCKKRSTEKRILERRV